MRRLGKKMNEIVFNNPEYITRQIDTAPARFKDGAAAGFRQPAPGTNVGTPNIPTTAPGRSKFNIRYFDRDSRRAPDETILLGTDVKLLAATEEGFGEAGVLATTGINTIPTHLPGPTWRKDVEAIVKHLETNNLPPIPGVGHKFKPGTGNGFQA